MNELPTWAWLLSGLAATGFLLGASHVLATLTRNTTQVQELRHRVALLRLELLAARKATDLGLDPEELPKDVESLAAYLRGEIDPYELDSGPVGSPGAGDPAASRPEQRDAESATETETAKARRAA